MAKGRLETEAMLLDPFFNKKRSLSIQVRASLMIEHRCIERMPPLINKEAVRIRETKVQTARVQTDWGSKGA
jgi:hypothetical protein